jgi:hypothetical protein
MADKGRISNDELHNSITQLLTNAESISWNRFNNYLISITLLLLVWAAIFINSTCLGKLLLIVIAAFGLLVSFAWICVGYRSRAYVDLFIEIGCALESKCCNDENNTIQPISDLKNLNKETVRKIAIKRWTSWARSTLILTVTPSCFAFLFLILIVLSASK